MVEALAFVHSKKVIHRDLKPSNIFMTTKLDISIGTLIIHHFAILVIYDNPISGDFGVATVMNDARTRTRTTVG